MSLIPVAQYLRMSTEHQQYSLENQAAAIRSYAENHGFCIIETYSDGARSGVVLARRLGLQKLLQDVVSGKSMFKAVLVYDVSRWGRFQDTDEAAHYEFLCKAAGVPVHYCAEAFSNDGSLSSLIMKALKRAMAGEYSRELGVKVLEGQKRLARLGFKQGGIPGYGLRRMLISADGQQKFQLADGERKSIATDRVILVPGPLEELQCVREIYRMFLIERRSSQSIATELNYKGIHYLRETRWNNQTVLNILQLPKYTGCHVFNRTSQKLCSPTLRLPRSEWIVKDGAFESLIDRSTYDKVQQRLRERTVNRSDEELLVSLRSLLTARGRLSHQLIKSSPDTPSPSTYRYRFGSLGRAYELIGYGKPADFSAIDLRRRTQALRKELIERIAALFPETVLIIRKSGRCRSQLRLQNGRLVSVIVARAVHAETKAIRWRVDPIVRERRSILLLARLNSKNHEFRDFHVFPRMDRAHRFDIEWRDPWLKIGERLHKLSEFPEAMERVRS